MGAGEVELGFGEVEGGEGVEVLGAEVGEVCEEGFDVVVGDEGLEGEAVEGREGGLGAFEDEAGAG
jgi:hypothetical protein